MGLRINDFVGFGFVIVIFLYYLANKNSAIDSKYSKKILWLAGYVILASTIGFMLESGPSLLTYIKQFFRFFTGVAVFVSFPLLFRSKEDLRSLYIALILSTFVNTFFALGQILVGPGFMGLGYYELGDAVSLTGTYDHYGQYAMAAVMGPLVVLAFLGNIESKYKSMLIVLFVIYMAVGIGTLSRSVLICMVIELMALIFLLRSKHNIKFVFVLGIVLLIFVSSDYFSNQISGYKLRSEYEFEVLKGERDIEYLGHGRVGRWMYFGEKFMDYEFSKILLGAGLNIGPHGDWLYWLFMYGFIGLILYLKFYLGLLRVLYKIYKKVKNNSQLKTLGIASLAGMTIFLIIGAFVSNSSMIIDYQIVIMGLSSLFIYNYRMSLSEKNEK